VICCVEHRVGFVAAMVADDQPVLLAEVLGAEVFGVLFELNPCVHGDPGRDALE
jgi:hypothetical protein